MQTKKMFLTATEVAEVLTVSVPMAYKIIRQMNDEMKEKGYLTICGKVNTNYFESKIFGGLTPEEVPNASL